jgi:site-specific DNA recombinase
MTLQPLLRTGVDQVVAREFLRVSFDRSGRQRSNEEQSQDNVDAITENGWVVHPEPYSEVGSASEWATKERVGFPSLIADLKSGRFGAQVLVAWEGSRNSRQVREWVELIDAARDAGVVFFITTHERTYDPDNPTDYKALINDANDAQYESAKTRKRIVRSMNRAAEAGRPHGIVAYGYRRVYDPQSGRLVGQEPHPDEAPVVRRMFELVNAGHSLRSVSRAFNADGIPTRKGGEWLAATIRRMAINPTYAGLRCHTPKGASVYSGPTTDAQWEGLVSEELFLSVKARLSDPSRKTSRPGRGVHLLSMIARCADCGAVMVGRYPKVKAGTYRAYDCRGQCTRVDADALDAFARESIAVWLGSRDIVRALLAAEGNGDALRAARRDLAAIKVELAELYEEAGGVTGMSAKLLNVTERNIKARESAAQDRVDHLATPAVLRSILGTGPDIVARWRSAPLSAKREVVKVLTAPEAMGTLKVRPVRARSAPIEARAFFDGGGVLDRDGVDALRPLLPPTAEPMMAPESEAR